MSSSTSSSERSLAPVLPSVLVGGSAAVALGARRLSSEQAVDGPGRDARARRAVLLVLFGLLVAELVVRAGVLRWSGELRRIRSFPEVTERLARSPGPRVLFLGNSLVDEDVDLPVVRRSWVEAGAGEVAAAEVFVHASDLVEWAAVLRRHFLDPGRAPDVLVLPFLPSHLADREALGTRELGRLAEQVETAGQALDLLGLEVRDLGGRVELALACASELVASRHRFRDRLLGAALPGYRGHSARLHGWRRNGDSGRSQVASYRRLGRVLDAASGAGVRVVLVACPARVVPEVPPALRAALRRPGVRVLDLREKPAFEASDFRDAAHLLPGPARRFSAALAEGLLAELREVSAR